MMPAKKPFRAVALDKTYTDTCKLEVNIGTKNSIFKEFDDLKKAINFCQTTSIMNGFGRQWIVLKLEQRKNGHFNDDQDTIVWIENLEVTWLIWATSLLTNTGIDCNGEQKYDNFL